MSNDSKSQQFRSTEVLTVEIPSGLTALLNRLATERRETLNSYVSMLLVKGAGKG